MKVLMITGSRGWTDAASIFDVLSDYRTDEWVVIHGGAKGADKLAGQIAENMGFEVQVYLADWVGNGRAAGFIRNTQMAKVADQCLAFWDGESRGTKHAIDECRRLEVPTRVRRTPVRLVALAPDLPGGI